jgi:branched-chain amino acid transport system substrate-binding protein
MGSYSSAIAASISEVAERNKVVLWEMSGAADALLQKGYTWTFRNEANASAWGAESVEFIMGNDAQIQEKLGKPAKDLVVAIVHEDGPYGTAVADGNAATAKKYGLNVPVNEAYSSKSVDLSSVIMKVKAANRMYCF